MSNYTVYRTTNKLNGMFYIGVHKTKNPNDHYLGSGKRLKLAIEKYGIEAFQKEVLFVFSTPEEAYSKEKELVTEEVLDSGKCYNLKLGGEGGWDYANKSGLSLAGVGKRDYKEIARKVKLAKSIKPPVYSEEARRKISLANERTNKSRSEKNRISSTGKIKTQDQKNKIRESLKRYWELKRAISVVGT